MSLDRKLDHIHSVLHEVQRGINHIGDLMTKGFETMATKEQLDALRLHVAALIDEAVKDITEAVKEAQEAPPEQADPAIDALDASVTETTKALHDAAAKLRNPPA